MRTLRTVKKEIRILGLDACRNGEVLGAVYRGGSYLDGVIRFHLPKTRVSSTLSRLVCASPYYPELRVLTIHDSRSSLDARTLGRLTSLPFIEVATRQQPGFSRRLLRGGSLFLKTDLDDESVARIISLTWARGRMPEPLRVAHLLAISLQTGSGR